MFSPSLRLALSFVDAAFRALFSAAVDLTNTASTQGFDILFTPISTSHLLMFAGSNRTQLPTRKLGIVPRFARRRIVNLETFNRSASSSAVMAR
jgi:hypothetical protein